jgi:serine/threonine protein phosphatase PrpC
MGCSDSKGGKKDMPGQRSAQIGQDEPQTPKSPKPKQEVSECNEMIESLKMVNIIQLTGTVFDTGRMVSVGSVTTGKQNDFDEEPMEMCGDEALLNSRKALGLGFACKKGKKPESPNQDAWMLLDIEKQLRIYGVFDGHGQKGHDSAHFVKDNLPKLMVSDPRIKENDLGGLLTETFQQTQAMVVAADKAKMLKAQLSGTTVTVVVHQIRQNKLWFAHCADSSAVLGAWSGPDKKKLIAKHVTKDHKPDMPEEKARIEKAGGRVEFDGYSNHRVYCGANPWPGLNMSRCMGDLKGQKGCGLTAAPEVTCVSITEDLHVLLVCSDGVWEFIEPKEALEYVRDKQPENAAETVEGLTKMAWDRWMKEEKGHVVDDITCMLVYLNLEPGAADVRRGA